MGEGPMPALLRFADTRNLEFWRWFDAQPAPTSVQPAPTSVNPKMGEGPMPALLRFADTRNLEFWRWFDAQPAPTSEIQKWERCIIMPALLRFLDTEIQLENRENRFSTPHG